MTTLVKMFQLSLPNSEEKKNLGLKVQYNIKLIYVHIRITLKLEQCHKLKDVSNELLSLLPFVTPSLSSFLPSFSPFFLFPQNKELFSPKSSTMIDSLYFKSIKYQCNINYTRQYYSPKIHSQNLFLVIFSVLYHQLYITILEGDYAKILTGADHSWPNNFVS